MVGVGGAREGGRLFPPSSRKREDEIREPVRGENLLSSLSPLGVSTIGCTQSHGMVVPHLI